MPRLARLLISLQATPQCPSQCPYVALHPHAGPPAARAGRAWPCPPATARMGRNAGSRREWSCAWLWWCERRVAGAGGAGRPWGASIGLAPMIQASGRCSCVCVRAGTYAQFSRGVPGEGHERRRPRVYWRVGVRSMPGGRDGARRAVLHAEVNLFKKKRLC